MDQYTFTSERVDDKSIGKFILACVFLSIRLAEAKSLLVGAAMTERTALIIEPLFSGHHSAYLQWIIPALRAEGFRILLATSEENVEHPGARALLAQHGEYVELEPLPARSPLRWLPQKLRPVEIIIAYWWAFRRAFKRANRHRIDLVLLPYLDYCTYALALLGSPFSTVRWCGIVMRPAFHYARMGIKAPHKPWDQWKQYLFLRLLGERSLGRLLTIDESLYLTLQEQSPLAASRLNYLPDPVSNHVALDWRAACATLKIPDEACVILCFGSLTARKGVAELLRAANEPAFPAKIHLLFAGKQHDEIRSLLASDLGSSLRRRGVLHEIDHHLTQDEESLVFAASDLVWMGYVGHYQMSGVLAQSGAAGLPVIACQEGLIGWLTKRHQSGIVVPVSHAAEVAETIATLVSAPDEMERLGSNGRTAFAAHTIDNAQATLRSAIGGC